MRKFLVLLASAVALAIPAGAQAKATPNMWGDPGGGSQGPNGYMCYANDFYFIWFYDGKAYQQWECLDGNWWLITIVYR